LGLVVDSIKCSAEHCPVELAPATEQHEVVQPTVVVLSDQGKKDLMWAELGRMIKAGEVTVEECRALNRDFLRGSLASH
jgi:hypothetical protein